MRYVLILKRSNLFSSNNHEMNVINEGSYEQSWLELLHENSPTHLC